jgi:predicted GIY-YIG superfamily endonuclease
MANIWTEEKCLQEIKKYEYRNDFYKKSPGAYAACKRNTWHLHVIKKLQVKLNRNWTKEQIVQLASKCKTRKEFIGNHNSAYQIAIKKKWKDEILENLPTQVRYWDFDSCHKEALIYKTKSDFNKGSGGAYMYASKNKILDKICSHMQVLGNEYKRMIYAYEFSDGYAYVGLTYNEKKRQYEHFYEKRGPVAKHIKKTGIKPVYIKLHDYVSKEAAIKLEDEFINQYRQNGWKMLNGNKGGALGGNEIQWTFETCLDIAQNYNRKEDLRWAPGLGGLYNAARKNGWWNQICAHMTEGNVQWTKSEVLKAAQRCEFVGEFQKKYGAAYRSAKDGGYLEEIHSLLKKKINYWDLESVTKEASKYKTIVEFQKNNSGAYNYAHRNKVLEQVTSHMTKLTFWNLELCRKEAKKYEKKYDFMRFSASCYNHARKNGYLDEICIHMEQRKWGKNTLTNQKD